MENKKNSKKIIIISLIGIFLCIIGLCIYLIVSNSNKVNNDKKTSNKNDSKLVIDKSDVLINDVKQLGVIGIVYLDPTNLKAKCDKKTCMKFYVFDDSDNNYKMILDHNVSDSVIWSNDFANADYKISEVKKTIDELKWNKNLNVEAIGIPDIVKAIGNENLESTDENNRTVCAKTPESYAWLFNNSYWTSSILGGNNSKYYFWTINNTCLNAVEATESYGVRPVITVSKSLFK